MLGECRFRLGWVASGVNSCCDFSLDDILVYSRSDGQTEHDETVQWYRLPRVRLDRVMRLLEWDSRKMQSNGLFRTLC